MVNKAIGPLIVPIIHAVGELALVLEAAVVGLVEVSRFMLAKDACMLTFMGIDCFKCNQPGHWASNCPNDEGGGSSYRGSSSSRGRGRGRGRGKR